MWIGNRCKSAREESLTMMGLGLTDFVAEIILSAPVDSIGCFGCKNTNEGRKLDIRFFVR